jgi:hypothetical protein
LSVPTGRSSPVIRDLDGDGKKDLLVGNTEGQLLFYRNTGSDGAPSFSGYIEIQAAGVPINLPGTPRSRPFVCDWTGDGLLDVLIGSGDGKVRLYQGLYEPGDLNCDGSVNNFDITPFVLALTATPPDYPEYYAAYADCFRDLGDINGDGHLDNFDITPFVALLAGG